MDESMTFYRPPDDEASRIQYLHGFIAGCNAGRAATLDVIARTKDQAGTHVLDPELGRRRQLAEVEILEAEARIKKVPAYPPHSVKISNRYGIGDVRTAA